MPAYLGERYAFDSILKTKRIRYQFIALKPDVLILENYLGFSKKLSKDIEVQKEAEKNAQMFSDEVVKFEKSSAYAKLLVKYGLN